MVHDDLYQWGGAERVLVALSEIFPDAPIYTSVCNFNHPLIRQQLASKKIITSFMQNIPGWVNFYKALLPFYPIAFEQFDFSEFDLVISQTTRFAKSIITKPSSTHICYCHTPPRFLWNFSGQKVPWYLSFYMSLLRSYDLISSHRVDLWIAGSKNAQKRIKKVYKTNSIVLYPFVDLKRLRGVETFDGGYLLVLSRLNSYKRVDLAVEAATLLQIPLKVVGDGPQLNYLKKIAGPKVDFLTGISEQNLTQLIAGCKVLIVPAEEDFGLSALEAQALGKPVVAFGKGGALENVVEGESGYFFKHQSAECLIRALHKLDRKGYNQNKCRELTRRFSRENFVRNFRAILAQYGL